jgi:hypothetical protein
MLWLCCWFFLSSAVFQIYSFTVCHSWHRSCIRNLPNKDSNQSTYVSKAAFFFIWHPIPDAVYLFSWPSCFTPNILCLFVFYPPDKDKMLTDMDESKMQRLISELEQEASMQAAKNAAATNRKPQTKAEFRQEQERKSASQKATQQQQQRKKRS